MKKERSTSQNQHQSPSVSQMFWFKLAELQFILVSVSQQLLSDSQLLLENTEHNLKSTLKTLKSDTLVAMVRSGHRLSKHSFKSLCCCL